MAGVAMWERVRRHTLASGPYTRSMLEYAVVITGRCDSLAWESEGESLGWGGALRDEGGLQEASI